MGSSLVERLAPAERQAVANLLFAANSLAAPFLDCDRQSRGAPDRRHRVKCPGAPRPSGPRALGSDRDHGDARSSRWGPAACACFDRARAPLHFACEPVRSDRRAAGRVDPDTRDRLGNGEKLRTMAALASVQVRAATDAFRMRDLKGAERLDRDDDVLDVLNREIVNAVAQLDSGAEERDLGFRQVLIARSLERIGDNAVDIGEQTVFVVTARRTELPRRLPAPPPHPGRLRAAGVAGTGSRRGISPAMCVARRRPLECPPRPFTLLSQFDAIEPVGMFAMARASTRALNPARFLGRARWR